MADSAMSVCQFICRSKPITIIGENSGGGYSYDFILQPLTRKRNPKFIHIYLQRILRHGTNEPQTIFNNFFQLLVESIEIGLIID